MRRAISLLATGLLSATLVVAGAEAANADPANCSWGLIQGGNGSWAQCMTGSGSYRSKVSCNSFGGQGVAYYAYGQWVRASSASEGRCDRLTWASDPTMEVGG